jgi:hypothetical protein
VTVNSLVPSVCETTLRQVIAPTHGAVDVQLRISMLVVMSYLPQLNVCRAATSRHEHAVS